MQHLDAFNIRVDIGPMERTTTTAFAAICICRIIYR